MSNIKKTVMQRVYALYLLKRALSPSACSVYMLVVFLVALFSLVSVGSVVLNAAHIRSISQFYDFLASAILNAEVSVQLTTLGLLVSLGFVGFQMYRFTKSGGVGRMGKLSLLS